MSYPFVKFFDIFNLINIFNTINTVNSVKTILSFTFLKIITKNAHWLSEETKNG